MKAIMYHYVRPGAAGLPHFPYLALGDFERQLDHFATEYGFVERDAFAQWLKGGPVPEGVLLTFDDGLVDHVHHVLPALRSRGLFGLFYVASSPVRTGEFLGVHKVHLAIGRLGGAAALAWLAKQYPEVVQTSESGADPYARQQADAATKRVKRLFNWELKREQRAGALDALFAHAFDDRIPDWRAFYLDEAGLDRLVGEGMLVGAHGHDHVVLSQLDASAQRQEIAQSCAFIRARVGNLDAGYCYAYGAFNADSEQIVADEGCLLAWSIGDRDVDAPVTAASRFRLPRHNCNRFPHGTVSFDAGGSEAVLP
jgi:peptidoglycan/xylan/chitin deacetylase (PgdA/CDA1 family)